MTRHCVVNLPKLGRTRCLSICLAVLGSPGPWAGEVEALHYWTSGAEAKSLAEPKGMKTNRGHT